MSETLSQEQVRTLMSGGHVPVQKAKRTVRELTLELPHPGKDCNPNSRGHWSKKHKAMKAMREACEAVAAYELRKVNARQPMWERATVQAKFYRPGKLAKRMDQDNCIASLKGCLDGLKDAGVIRDDIGLTHLPPQQFIGSEATERKLVLVISEA